MPMSSTSPSRVQGAPKGSAGAQQAPERGEHPSEVPSKVSDTLSRAGSIPGCCCVCLCRSGEQMRGVQRAGTGGMAAAAWGPARCCSPSPIACGVPEPPPPLALLCPARICFSPQVAMNDLSPAGPIQAVEIFMESPSLADMCRMHHAVIRRIQVPQTAGPCRSPRAPQLPPDTAPGSPGKSDALGSNPGGPAGGLGMFSLADEPGVTPG